MSLKVFLVLVVLLSGGPAMGQAADEKPKPASLDLRGSVVPAKRASVSSMIPGRIAEVLVEEGQAVKKGQVLFRLDRATHEAELRRAEAQVVLAMSRLKLVEVREGEEATVRTELARAEEGMKAAEQHLMRVKKLYQDGGVSESEFHKADAAHRTARTEVERTRVGLETLRKQLAAQSTVARAEVELARAGLEPARRAVEAAEVRAPLDGVILGVNVEVGAHTNPALFGLANSATLCEIANTAEMKIVAEVPEAELQRVSLGQKCQITLDAAPKARLTGRVERLSPVVNRGRVTVWVGIDAKGDTVLRTGMSAFVRLVSSTSP